MEHSDEEGLSIAGAAVDVAAPHFAILQFFPARASCQWGKWKVGRKTIHGTLAWPTNPVVVALPENGSTTPTDVGKTVEVVLPTTYTFMELVGSRATALPTS